MKLGFLTDKIQDIPKARRLGFQAIELNSAALGQAGTGPLDRAKTNEAAKLAADEGIAITALAYYDVAWAPPAPDQFTAAFERVFDAAEILGVSVVAAMSGFNPELKFEENLNLWTERFAPVAEIAESRNLRIAFENWMGFGGPLPHKPCNFGGCPGVWEEWFKRVPSKALGIEFDPSHLYWQGIDHIRALKEFKDRVYHVHAKDTEMLPAEIYRWGANGRTYRFRVPGYGEIDWTQFVAALDEIGYSGGLAIEHEDPIYSGDRFDEGLARGWQVLNSLINPTRV
jgi:sugar phosphate isomerase/epimerase